MFKVVPFSIVRNFRLVRNHRSEKEIYFMYELHPIFSYGFKCFFVSILNMNRAYAIYCAASNAVVFTY